MSWTDSYHEVLIRPSLLPFWASPCLWLEILLLRNADKPNIKGATRKDSQLLRLWFIKYKLSNYKILHILDLNVKYWNITWRRIHSTEACLYTAIETTDVGVVYLGSTLFIIRTSENIAWSWRQRSYWRRALWMLWYNISTLCFQPSWQNLQLIL